MFLFFSDACDPNWRNIRDGLIGSAFAVSSLAFTFVAVEVWVHICYNKSEELQSYFLMSGGRNWQLKFSMYTYYHVHAPAKQVKHLV